MPPPPPEFIRLIRDRAELKAKCLLFQADQNKQLHLFSTDQEQVLFRLGQILSQFLGKKGTYLEPFGG